MFKIKHDMHTCPRRPRRIEVDRHQADSPFRGSGPDLDHWEVRSYPDSPSIINNGVRCCTYCGSMHPDDFIAHIEAGTAEVGPTDKSYKAYVEYIPSGVSRGKFYYQHLSREQKQRFVDLYNDRTMKIGVPGHFYVSPFFMGDVPA